MSMLLDVIPQPFSEAYAPLIYKAKTNFGLPPLRPFSRAAAGLMALLF
jgi:hypothetical protein